MNYPENCFCILPKGLPLYHHPHPYIPYYFIVNPYSFHCQSIHWTVLWCIAACVHDNSTTIKLLLSCELFQNARARGNVRTVSRPNFSSMSSSATTRTPPPPHTHLQPASATIRTRARNAPAHTHASFLVVRCFGFGVCVYEIICTLFRLSVYIKFAHIHTLIHPTYRQRRHSQHDTYQ